MPPQEISAKPEPNSAKNSDQAESEAAGAHQSFILELGNSALYSAIEQPSLGVAQFFGNDAMKSVKNAFSWAGLEPPPAEKFNSSGWYAQTFGSAVGMVAPFALTKFGLGKIGAFGEAASAESGVLSRQAAVGLSLKESALTGMAYGTLFTPSSDAARDAGFKSFLMDRTVTGVGSALTFTTLTAGSLALGRVAESTVATRFGATPFLSNRIVSGALSGLPGGFVGAEYDSLAHKNRFANGAELAESMFSMGVVGGVFGGATYLKPFGRGTENLQPRTDAEVANSSQSPASKDGTLTRSVVEQPQAENQIVQPRADGQAPNPVPEARLGSQIASMAEGRGEAPSIINPNEFKTGSQFRQDVKIELMPHEQELWRDIQRVKTAADFDAQNDAIFDLPADRKGWFTDVLDQKGAKLTNAEMNAMWPEMLQKDPHQVYRIAKLIGPERATEIWQNQFDALKTNPNPQLADQIARTTIFIEPGKQLDALGQMLDMPNPPAYVDMMSVQLARENQIPAAKMLVDRGIEPNIETSQLSPSVWADWVFNMEPGKMRSDLLHQVGRKVTGSTRDAAHELNSVYKIAQEKADPTEIESLNSILTSLTRNSGANEGRVTRSAALKDLDPQFISRMMFYEEHWAKSDQLAAQNPELVRALAVNSRFNPNIERSAYLSDMMTGKPPITAEQLTQSVVERSRTADQQGRNFLLSPGDIKALVVKGVAVSPEQVPPLMETLRAEVADTFALDGDKPVNRERLLAMVTLADSLGRNNPEAFEKGFKEPIETLLRDPARQYSRRLEASKALGELQRMGFDSAQAIQMPELRMGKIVDLPPADANAMRGSIERALFNRQSLREMLGDGPLGRLMPSIFGDHTEGGIVGREQHATHDFKLHDHLLSVVEKVGQDPEFAKLLPKDQVNVLWAALLHDVGKQEHMIDFDHNRTSISMAWGILRTLGYSEQRIQRITDIMSRDADLRYMPDVKNSVRLGNNKDQMDDVVNNYRHADALDMVAMLNRADIKSVKDNEAWWQPDEVQSEMGLIRDKSKARRAELNRNLLPVLTSATPKGFAAYEMSDYSKMGHSSYDLEQLLKQKPTVESPEYSASVSLHTPENHQVYNDGPKVIALVDGNFEHIAQASRANLSTGNAIGWDGHVKLVDQWSTDYRAKALADEAEQKLAEIGIPASPKVAAADHPRLNHLRRILGQFESYDELVEAAGADNPYVKASDAITKILTTERNGDALKANNELKLNNPIISGVGLLREVNQPIYFEGLSQADLHDMWHGNVPDYVSSGPPETAPAKALVVKADVVAAAKKNNLPIVVLHSRSPAK